MKNPCLRNRLFTALIFTIIFSVAACKKSTVSDVTTLPTVATTSLIMNVTSTSAQSGGVITSGGGADVTAYGICYSTTNKTPTTSDTKIPSVVTGDGTAIINFTSSITGLTANTIYYIRAYAVNNVGTAYGSVVQFTTSTSLASVVATVTTFAGNGTAGNANGQGTSALFSSPNGVAVDSKGNVYVSDSFNNIIRVITPAGAVTTFAGNGTIGYADGAAASAEFYGPQGLAFDKQDNLYVADLGNNVIRKITTAGIVSTFAGNGTAGYVDGNATTLAEFNNPTGLALDAAGDMFIADRGNNVVRKLNPAGLVITLAGTKTAGYVNSTGLSASFSSPNGVAVDASGNVYVADLGNAAIRKINTADVVSTVAGGPGQPDLFNLPAALTFDAAGNLYIVDESGRILEYTTANILYNLAGSLNAAGFVNGTGTAALFSNPQGIAMDAAGNIYIADQSNNSIRKITVALTN